VETGEVPDYGVGRLEAYWTGVLSAGMIAKAGQMFLPIPTGKRWSLVATSDIAAKAASWLLDRSWSGHHRVGVHGPKDLSPDDAAAIISSALGKPVKCVEATPDQARGAMKGMGMPDFVVEIIMEQYDAFRDGRLESAAPRTPETTTSTTLAEFTRTTLMLAIRVAF
jgi:NAD(P)H dehydrogenase (quinone)